MLIGVSERETQSKKRLVFPISICRFLPSLKHFTADSNNVSLVLNG